MFQFKLQYRLKKIPKTSANSRAKGVIPKGGKGKKARTPTPEDQFATITSGTTLFFKILYWYGDPAVCPYSNMHNAYIRAKVKEVDHNEMWVVVAYPILDTDSERIPFDVLADSAKLELPFGAREITQEEYDTHKEPNARAIPENMAPLRGASSSSSSKSKKSKTQDTRKQPAKTTFTISELDTPTDSLTAHWEAIADAPWDLGKFEVTTCKSIPTRYRPGFRTSLKRQAPRWLGNCTFYCRPCC